MSVEVGGEDILNILKGTSAGVSRSVSCWASSWPVEGPPATRALREDKPLYQHTQRPERQPQHRCALSKVGMQGRCPLGGWGCQSPLGREGS